MATNDKKDYIRVLTALDRTGTLDAAFNQLGEVQMETEDSSLGDMLARASAVRQQALHHHKKVRLVALNPNECPDLVAAVRTLYRYCLQQRDASQPQWEILASRAGWTPPR
jgi:hypothetical protein